MEILFISGRESSYDRNQVLIHALQSFSNVTILSPNERPKSLITESIKKFWTYFRKYKNKKFDFIFIGFYGFLLILFIRFLTKTPIIFDAFISNYDTLITDRKTAKERSILAFLSKALDNFGCSLANHIVIDTSTNLNFFVDNYKIPTRKISHIPVGCNETLFSMTEKKLSDETKTVLFYSTFLPLHGVSIVVESARILKDKKIFFTIVGRGIEYPSSIRLIKKYRLSKINLFDTLPIQEIAQMVKVSDICLGGHFGYNEKSNRVIPGKIYQILASGKPLIAANTLSNRELLTDEENALLIPQNNPEQLANAILRLANDEALSSKLSINGRKLFENTSSTKVISEKLKIIINNLISD